jgi:hypothetical protein
MPIFFLSEVRCRRGRTFRTAPISPEIVIARIGDATATMISSHTFFEAEKVMDEACQLPFCLLNK